MAYLQPFHIASCTAPWCHLKSTRVQRAWWECQHRSKINKFQRPTGATRRAVYRLERISARCCYNAEELSSKWDLFLSLRAHTTLGDLLLRSSIDPGAARVRSEKAAIYSKWWFTVICTYNRAAKRAAGAPSFLTDERRVSPFATMLLLEALRGGHQPLSEHDRLSCPFHACVTRDRQCAVFQPHLPENLLPAPLYGVRG